MAWYFRMLGCYLTTGNNLWAVFCKEAGGLITPASVPLPGCRSELWGLDAHKHIQCQNREVAPFLTIELLHRSRQLLSRLLTTTVLEAPGAWSQLGSCWEQLGPAGFQMRGKGCRKCWAQSSRLQFKVRCLSLLGVWCPSAWASFLLKLV